MSLRALSPKDRQHKVTVTNPAGSISTTALLSVTAAAVSGNNFTPEDEDLSSVVRQALGANSVTGQTFLPQMDFRRRTGLQC